MEHIKSILKKLGHDFNMPKGNLTSTASQNDPDMILDGTESRFSFAVKKAQEAQEAQESPERKTDRLVEEINKAKEKTKEGTKEPETETEEEEGESETKVRLPYKED